MPSSWHGKASWTRPKKKGQGVEMISLWQDQQASGSHRIALAMRVALLCVLCIAALIMATTLTGCRRPESPSHNAQQTSGFPCALESSSSSLLSSSVISSLGVSAVQRVRCFVSSLARTEEDDEERIDAAVGLPSSSFVLFLPLGKHLHAFQLQKLDQRQCTHFQTGRCISHEWMPSATLQVCA